MIKRLVKKIVDTADGYLHAYLCPVVERYADEPYEDEPNWDNLPRIEIGDNVLVAIPQTDYEFLVNYDPANARDREPSKKDLIRVLQDLRDDLQDWRVL